MVVAVLEQLGRGVYRARAGLLTCWVLLAVAGATVGGVAFDRAENPDGRADAESALVDRKLAETDPEGEQLVVVLRGSDALAVDLVDQASRVIHEVRALPGVVEVRDPYTSGASDLFADDGLGSVVEVGLDPDLDDDASRRVAGEVVDLLRAIAVPTVLAGGERLAEEAFAEQAIRDAARGEGVALIVLLAVLVFALGSWVAGAIPVVTALSAVAGSLLCLAGLVTIAPVSEYAVNVVTLLGLGLTVDYSLLVLSRFREERSGAGARFELATVLARTLATAGRTVIVSGLSVGSALVGLMLLGDPTLGGMAMGGAVAVAVATLAALTLTPALIAIGHTRIPPEKADRRRSTLFGLATLAQARPWPILLASITFLLLLASPLLALQTGNSDARALPSDSEPRQAYEAVQEQHSELRTTPITVLAEPPPDDPRVIVIEQQISAVDGVADVITLDPLLDGSTRLLVEPIGETSGPQAQLVVKRLRALDTGTDLLVGGPAAELVDTKSAIGSRLPLATAIVVLVTGTLLLVLTGSLVVALKALALNLLSIAATLGVVTAIFQWGWGSSVLGFTSWGAVDLTTPLLLFMFAFGLSMDYHVFLVARIKEAWDTSTRGRGALLAGSREANDRAVLAGIAASGPVVTLAAVSIGIVFAGFAFGDLVAVKEFGVGMTVAIALDVTIVRGLMLPAAMTLLGHWNWWRPTLGRPATWPR